MVVCIDREVKRINCIALPSSTNYLNRDTIHTMASEVLKAWEECDKIDTLFVLVCTVFCWTIVPIVSRHISNLTNDESILTPKQVGIAYGGYSWRRNGLSSAIPAVLTIATCSIQWFTIGYTLAYGEGGWVFGDFKYALHIGVLSEPVGTIPAILFSEFQLVFEATVCAIAVGGFCERGRLLPIIPFIFVRQCRIIITYVWLLI